MAAIGTARKHTDMGAKIISASRLRMLSAIAGLVDDNGQAPSMDARTRLVQTGRGQRPGLEPGCGDLLATENHPNKNPEQNTENHPNENLKQNTEDHPNENQEQNTEDHPDENLEQNIEDHTSENAGKAENGHRSGGGLDPEVAARMNEWTG